MTWLLIAGLGLGLLMLWLQMLNIWATTEILRVAGLDPAARAQYLRSFSQAMA